MQQDLISALELEIPSEGSESVIPTRQMTGTSSIAVLPFVNLGPDRDIQYFCNGLAEELLTGLARYQACAWPRARRRFVSPRPRWTFAQFAANSASTRCSRHGAEGWRTGPHHRAARQRRGRMSSLVGRLRSFHCGCLRCSRRNRPFRRGSIKDIARRVPPPAVDSPAHAQRARVPVIFERTFLLDAALSRRLDHGARTFQECHRGRRRLCAGLRGAGGRLFVYRHLCGAATTFGFCACRGCRRACVGARPRPARAHTSLAFIKFANEWDMPGRSASSHARWSWIRNRR